MNFSLKIKNDDSCVCTLHLVAVDAIDSPRMDECAPPISSAERGENEIDAMMS